MSHEQPHDILEFPDQQKPEVVLDLNDGSNEQVTIIIVHHNRPEFLNILIQSIYLMSAMNNYEVVIVDNASGQETQEYLDVLQKEGIKIVRNATNEFWSIAANKGAAVADPNSKFLVFMHADCVVQDPSWLDLMINVSNGRGAGLVGLQLMSYYINKQKWDFIHEHCVLFTRDCWNECGPWREELPLVGPAFIMTLAAQYRGYKPQASTAQVVHHYKQFSGDPSEYEKLSEQSYKNLPKLIQWAQSKGK